MLQLISSNNINTEKLSVNDLENKCHNLHYTAADMRTTILDNITMSQLTKAQRLGNLLGCNYCLPEVISKISKSAKLLELSFEYESIVLELGRLGDIYEKRKSFQLVIGE